MRRIASLLPLLLLLLPLGCASERIKGDLHDMPVLSITGETVWEGRVEIDRIVIVRRGGHLMIAPGTKILFKKVDWDGDGIGDAEITVEGKLTAEGTRENPILFASAEDDPAPSDWKYLHVNFARDATIKHARISHAFSGIQVHYSRATIESCDFSHNIDGIRFSTADLIVMNTWSRQNRHGVRYEERGHPAMVTGNRISENEVGIFAVIESRGDSTFEANDIFDNATGVKMGWEQKADIPLRGNWWGEEGKAVVETFLDGRKDESLGRALVEPMAKAPFGIVPPFDAPVDDPDWQRAMRGDL